MDYHQIMLGAHLLGFALGLGGATISDIAFFKALRKNVLTTEQFAFLQTLSKVIWTGLILLIASGATIFYLIYAEQGSLPLLASPKWQAKLTFVAVVLLNGFVFRFVILPALKELIGQPLSLAINKALRIRLAIAGTISILSWYSIFLISLLPRTFRPDYLYFLGVYAVLLVVGVLGSNFVITKILNHNIATNEN